MSVYSALNVMVVVIASILRALHLVGWNHKPNMTGDRHVCMNVWDG